jgi:hypothetical protein
VELRLNFPRRNFPNHPSMLNGAAIALYLFSNACVALASLSVWFRATRNDDGAHSRKYLRTHRKHAFRDVLWRGDRDRGPWRHFTGGVVRGSVRRTTKQAKKKSRFARTRLARVILNRVVIAV